MPQLLGWIDSARVKQDMINARNLMTAAQAELTKQYAFHMEGTPEGDPTKTGEYQERPTAIRGCFGCNDNCDAEAMNTEYAKEVFKIADETPYLFIIGCGRMNKYQDSDIHKAFTVYVAMYMKTKDSKPLFYDGQEWTTLYLEKDSKKPGCVFEATGNKLKSNGVFIQYYMLANAKDRSVKAEGGKSVWKYLREKSK